MSDRAAASRNLILKLASGPRKIATSWIAEEKKNTKATGLCQRYKALDEALDRMDLLAADSLICPIHIM